MQNTITTVLGRKGEGKTTLAMELIRTEPRAIVLDTMGGYGPVVDKVIWGRDESIEAMLDASRKRRFRLALRVTDQADMLDILDMGWELTDYLLVVEETSLVTGSPPFLHPQLAQLIRFGRHRAISQLYIARRPTEIPRDVTAQSDLLVTFQQTELNDLKYLKESGFDPYHVRTLPQFQVAARINRRGAQEALPLPIAKRLAPERQGRLSLTDEPPADDDPLTESDPGVTAPPEASGPASPEAMPGRGAHDER